ncbi:MAG: alpha-ketoglutarate-dependent dioxygenase AlkB [Devosia sp.]|uniref:alpha-ketoglutarate-dependent dioxygenase AlkB n=1 Tax=Devosia sp. TaxID=1871048 RepID=UPI001A61AA81|nr:alpha-ketoglutarate-dependent dioxygenase AlkB [Devosia sp.]MBL8596335.1 alpha-ketoglutarate-dependent dioxygenase AlkB [Devosia sp.]
MPRKARELLAQIGALPWRDDLRRRVQHYGYRYDYKARRVTRDSYLGPLPEWLATLVGGLSADGIFEAVPDQVIVNEYLPGQGIAAHVDCEPCFGDMIASLSLGSGCTMESRRSVRSRRWRTGSNRRVCSCSKAHPALTGSMGLRRGARTRWAARACHGAGGFR